MRITKKKNETELEKQRGRQTIIQNKIDLRNELKKIIMRERERKEEREREREGER